MGHNTSIARIEGTRSMPTNQIDFRKKKIIKDRQHNYLYIRNNLHVEPVGPVHRPETLP